MKSSGSRPIDNNTSRTGYILSCLPSYNVIASKEYIEWEIEIDQIFAKHHMCNRRKVINAASSLISLASIWWKFFYDKEHYIQTWKDMKKYMRDRFVSDSYSIKLICDLHYLQQQDKTITQYYNDLNTLLLHCGLDESEQSKKQRFLKGLNDDIYDMLVGIRFDSLYDLYKHACKVENEINERQMFIELKNAEIKQCVIHIVDRLFSTNLTKGVEIKDKPTNTLEENEDVNVSTETIVTHSPNLPLSHDELQVVPCVKEKLCDDISVASIPQLMKEPVICAENNIFVPITSAHDELKLLSSLNTLGYIEFDVLCNLNNLKEKLF